MRVRQLSVLDLNDRDVPSFTTGNGVARHFEVRRLRTWMAVQQDVGGTRTFRPDIVLADIDFEDDPSVRDVVFSGCGEAKPLGPLLVLPYVASRAVWTFAVYSAHLKNKAPSGVMQSPWVLLPFGMLFAKLKGRVFGSSVMNQEEEYGSGTVEDEIARLPRLGNPAAALEHALQIHNRRLVEGVETGRLRVTNGERLRHSLKSLADKCKAAGDKALLAVDKTLFVELYSEGYGIDRIQWLSLCADIVDYQGDRIDFDGADEMLQYAEKLCGSDPAFQMAVEVIKLQDKHDELEKSRPAFDEVAAELYGNLAEETRREILWAGVLLANAHAWAVGHFATIVKKEIFERLGTSSEGNTYLGWFGARSASERVCQRSLRIPKLDEFKNRVKKTTSYHVEWGETELSPEDKIRISHYLAAFHENEGYILPAELPYLSTDDA